MVKIEAFVRSFKLDEVKATLESLEIPDVTISVVFCQVGLMAPMAMYRGTEYHVDIPRVKLGIQVSSLRAEEVIEALSRAARTNVLEMMARSCSAKLRMPSGSGPASVSNWRLHSTRNRVGQYL